MFADTSHWAPSFIATNDTADDAELTDGQLDRSRRGWVDAHADIDWALVRQLKGDSVDKVEAEIRKYRLTQGREPSTDDEREMGKPIIARVVGDHARSEAAGGRLWPAALEERYFKAVFDSQFGFGRLQPLFEIPTAENIIIHGCDSVRCTTPTAGSRDGRRSPTATTSCSSRSARWAATPGRGAPSTPTTST